MSAQKQRLKNTISTEVIDPATPQIELRKPTPDNFQKKKSSLKLQNFQYDTRLYSGQSSMDKIPNQFAPKIRTNDKLRYKNLTKIRAENGSKVRTDDNLFFNATQSSQSSMKKLKNYKDLDWRITNSYSNVARSVNLKPSVISELKKLFASHQIADSLKKQSYKSVFIIK